MNLQERQTQCDAQKFRSVGSNAIALLLYAVTWNVCLIALGLSSGATASLGKMIMLALGLGLINALICIGLVVRAVSSLNDQAIAKTRIMLKHPAFYRGVFDEIALVALCIPCIAGLLFWVGTPIPYVIAMGLGFGVIIGDVIRRFFRPSVYDA